MSSQALINKYRPGSFDEMVGHSSIIEALSKALESDSHPHSFLLSGPGGIGKTTSARIIADMLKCELIEIDAASNSGVDEARAVVELGAHMSLSGAGRRMILIDECHTLSKNAWQALLKILEEPPEHLYFALCTTDLAKVPETIIMRCYHVALRALKPSEIRILLDAVAALEEWTVDPDVMSAVIQASTGQPRKALSILQAVHDAPSREEAARIISLQDPTEPLLELCKHLVSGKPSWLKVKGFLERIDDEDWKEASMLAGRYIASCMIRAKTEQDAAHIWKLLDALTFPCDTYDRKIAFYSAIGKIIWADGIPPTPNPSHAQPHSNADDRF